MRLDQIAPAVAGLAKISFNSQASFVVMHPLDVILDPAMHIREYIRRGQVAGLFSGDVSSGQLNLREDDISEKSNAYHIASISIKMPRGLEPEGAEPKTLTIYKKAETGHYYFGKIEKDVFIKHSPAMNDIEVSEAIIEWARCFADNNQCKRRSFLKTFAAPTMADPVNLIDALKAGWAKLSGYMQRDSEAPNPAPRL